MDKAEKIELEYYELCPECGKEAYGFCDENLTGICNHCGAEIKICSHCPSSCLCKNSRETFPDWQRWCKSCVFEYLKCVIIECEFVFKKKKKKIVRDGFIFQHG